MFGEWIRNIFLSVASLAGAFDGDEANNDQKEHDYADDNTEGYYIHFVLPYFTLDFIFVFSFLFF